VRRLVFSIALSLVACDKHESPAPIASTTARAPVASVLPSASAAPVKAALWFEGKWRGSYDAEPYSIETAEKNTGAREWADDDGGEHVGDGTLELEITPEGRISGSAKGALGPQSVRGEVDETKFRLSFVPEVPGDRAFSGSAVLERDRAGESLKGRLSTSTGDSKTVRDAALVLEKVGPKPKAP